MNLKSEAPLIHCNVSDSARRDSLITDVNRREKTPPVSLF